VTEVTLLVINAMSVSTGNKHAARIFRRGLDLEPDIVLASECADFRACEVDADELYAWHQPGHLGDQVSGCAIGVRKGFGALTKPDARVGSFATPEGHEVTGRGIGTRLILRARVRTAPNAGGLSFRVAAGHAPPSRAPQARGEFMRNFARTRARFKGGDLNLPRRLAARALGRRVTGSGVLWLTMPRAGWRLVLTRAVDVGGDHRAVLVTVKKKEKQ
jgi:hypothetical protein